MKSEDLYYLLAGPAPVTALSTLAAGTWTDPAIRPLASQSPEPSDIELPLPTWTGDIHRGEP